MTFVRALGDDELWVGEMRGLRLEDRRVLLVRTADGVRAFEDRCAHLGLPLSSGRLDGSVLTCSGHHYQYDAETGQGINPRTVRLRSFAVKVEAGAIFVDLGATRKEGAVD
ncbi:MAG TPA: Rieske 2Fe-2S domain-containing protein [Polyangiaceae bacterium]